MQKSSLAKGVPHPGKQVPEKSTGSRGSEPDIQLFIHTALHSSCISRQLPGIPAEPHTYYVYKYLTNREIGIERKPELHSPQVNAPNKELRQQCDIFISRRLAISGNRQ